MKQTLFYKPGILPGKTLLQPFAGAVLLAALGYRGKRDETRKTQTAYRGRFVVCAGSAPASPKAKVEEAKHVLAIRQHLLDVGVPPELFWSAVTTYGQAVCVATVTGCRPLLEIDWPTTLFWEAGRSLWTMTDLWPIAPFPWAGRQGWSEVPSSKVDDAAEEWLCRAFIDGDAAFNQSVILAKQT